MNGAWMVHPAADLFPRLDGTELDELATDIRQRGLLEPVWLWNDPERGTVLLDGRNRIAACEAVKVPVRTQFYRGDDPIGFSVAQNLRRRHLTVGQKAFVALGVEPLYAAEAAKRVGGRPRRDEKPVADLPQVKARDRAAATVGASGRAVGQAKRIAQEAPDLADKVQRGEMALDRADYVLRSRDAEQRRIDQARREAAQANAIAAVDIRHGDFREALADLRGVDAVITDPPYPFEYLPLLADLAAWADKVLTPDGVLAVLMGQTYLPEVYRLLDGHRPYRWTACYLTLGAGYVSHARRLQCNWKPLLIYGGGPRFMDVIRADGDTAGKSHHKWGQDYDAFHTIVERLTQRGQTVVDPFMGSGTTLLAAHALGRHAIGCDIDPESVDVAKRRLS